MTKKQTYWEPLQHPNWQKKRLEVLSLHGFACENCGTEEKMLHVHHTYYEKGLSPWEYPTESLRVLCEKCHREAQDRMLLLNRQIGKLELFDLEELHGYALGLEARRSPNAVLDVFAYEVACGIADCWRISNQDVIDALKDGVIDGHQLENLRKRREGKC